MNFEKEKFSTCRKIVFFILIVAVLLFLLHFVYIEHDDGDFTVQYRQFVLESAEEFDIPAEYIFAVIYVESSFDSDAVSSQGAKGLMQLMPATYEEICGKLKIEYTEKNIFDPKINIRCGTYYLSYLYDIFLDWETVFAAYNAGPGRVGSWLATDEYVDQNGKLTVIPFPETENYVKKVISTAAIYRERIL